MGIRCFMVEPTGEMTPFINGISSPLYVRLDTGEVMPWRDFEPGAMCDLNHPISVEMRKDGYRYRDGFDGRHLLVKLPGGGDWHIDSRAANCTMPGDDDHRCWLRTGEPPLITVGKTGPGKTCAAGGGSIHHHQPDYHGFLRDGEFTAA